jgi:surface antigen
MYQSIHLDTLIFNYKIDIKNEDEYRPPIVNCCCTRIGGHDMTTQIENVSKTTPKPKRTRAVAVALAAVMSLGILSGCVTDQGNKQIMGSMLGAGLGGWAGSKVGNGKGQLAATAAGVVIGGLLGNSVGQSLDRADQAYASRAQNDALYAPVGQTISWSNPDSGNYGQVTPTREGTHTRTGAYCREYQTEIIVGGEQQVGYGTACQMPNGDWNVQS